MRRIGVLALLCCAPGLPAQTPPVPGAILVAGSNPARVRATEAVINPLAIALAPDGSLYIAAFQGVRRVSPDGFLSFVAGPWDSTQAFLTAITTDRAGDLYVADVGQHTIWKLDPQGRATAIAGQDSNQVMASSLAVDSRGNVYYGTTARVWKIAPDGTISAFAGTGNIGVPVTSLDPTPALNYGLIYVSRLAIDAADNLYVNDVSGLLRVSPDGLLHRIPYTGLPEGASVSGIAPDGSGGLVVGLRLVDDFGRIGRIGTDGILRIIRSDPAGCAPSLRPVSDVALSGSGLIYVAEPANFRVRTLGSDGLLRTVAGGPGGAFAGDGGPAIQARLAHPAGLAMDSKGNLYFADEFNNRIRRVDPSGAIETVVGSGSGAGEDLSCTDLTVNSLLYPAAVAVDADDNLYIADTGHHRILKRAIDGTVTDVPGSREALVAPAGLAFAFGNLYIADTDQIRFMDASGVIRTFYGPISKPAGVAVDGAGNVFAGNLEISSSGRVFALPIDWPLHALAVGARGELFASDERAQLLRVEPDCSLTPLVSTRVFDGIAVAPNGDLFVSDSDANLIWRIPAPAAGGGSPPVSLPFVSVVNGATLTPRMMWVTVRTRFGESMVLESFNEAVAPGERVTISGTCLAPLSFQQGPAGLETQVLSDGVAAPILSAGPNQVVAVVPYEIVGRTATNLEVRYHGQKASAKLDVSAASVGIFAPPGATFSRGTVASVLITGEGQTDPPGVTGQPSDGSPRRPLGAVQVKVKDVPAEVISVAPDPGTIGSTRVTFRVPDAAPPGPGTVMVIVGTSFNSISATVI